MQSRRNWYVGIGLVVATMILYWPVTGFPFVNFDDPLYVYQNPQVLKGLSWHGIQWAANSVVCANWHPVTILSLMLDCSVYNKFAGGYHLTNLLLHSINVVLLWLVMKRLIGSIWPAVLIAALFAWHPINVESVAWVAERKNVLSGLFFIVTIWAYLRFVENPNALGYALTLLIFALGLLAKPMLVTLPFLLLLLDYWPLRRISFDHPIHEMIQKKQTGLLIVEKIPFMLLSLGDCIITYVVQNGAGAVKSLAQVPIDIRLMNIPVAYVTYLGKIFWPINLSVFYDFPAKFPVIATVFSLFFLVAVTLAAWHWRIKYGWFLIGWFWFLGVMVPVIGLVQSGYHAMADRNMYLPGMGVFLILACVLRKFWPAHIQLQIGSVIGLTILLGILLMLTRRQIMFWQDSVVLFNQTVAINPKSATTHELLARAYSADGAKSQAIIQYGQAVKLDPDETQFQYDLGRELISANRFVEAAPYLGTALEQEPESPLILNAYGVALMMSGKSAEAAHEFLRAIKFSPDYAKPYFNLAKVQSAEGLNRDAITNFNIVLKLQPDWTEAMENLASAYAANGETNQAISISKGALKMALSMKQQALANRISDELKTYQSTLNP